MQRDVRQLVNVQDLGTFTTFVRLLAGRVGQLLNKESLARDVGISVPTVTKWLWQFVLDTGNTFTLATFSLLLHPHAQKEQGRRTFRRDCLFRLAFGGTSSSKHKNVEFSLRPSVFAHRAEIQAAYATACRNAPTIVD